MQQSARTFTGPRLLAGVVGVIGAIALVMGWMRESTRESFFSAYLYAYLFWLGITLGSLVLLMLHNLTGGDWGEAVRRVAEPAARVLPLMVLLFLPVVAGLRELFPWAQPAAGASEEVLHHRLAYLNVPFFLLRAGVYFVIWSVLSTIVRRLEKQWHVSHTERVRSRLRGWSAAGLIVYLFTITHAGYDWAMSRDTDFYSTAFGFIVAVGEVLSAVAFSILMIALLRKSMPRSLHALLARKPEQNPPEAGAPSVLNDVGNILLTLVILWAYVSFMQLLVIWMGNSGEDNGYYIKRGLGQPSPWRWVGLALVVIHFFVPFFILLFRATKKYLPALALIAGVVFVAHLLEQYWLIAPSSSLRGPHLRVTWMDGIAPLAIGGLWMVAYLSLLPASLESLPMERKEERLSEAGESKGVTRA